MIGEDWTDGGEARARESRADPDHPRRIAVVTGTRAEFGLLAPVMEAVRARADCQLLVIAAGAHLIQPALTFREVKQRFEVADSIPMQTIGRVGRAHDVEALGKGIARFGRSFESLRPEWVLVLGDRIEALAAASAACVGGWALAHVHGGDRAEGVADEAMRHAITKMAHLHFPASAASAERIERMGEDASRIHTVGSPALDGLGAIEPMDDDAYGELGAPEIVVLAHPCGRADGVEERDARALLDAIGATRALALHPNHDPGRDGIMRALMDAPASVRVERHLPRERFVALLKRVGAAGGALVGNSSAGLIECSAIGCASVDIGDRQRGRERCEGCTVHAGAGADQIRAAIAEARALDPGSRTHPFGDGTAGAAIARVLAATDPVATGLVRKLNAY